METHPPRLIERLVGALIPIECREHVLGDLHERYESPIRYLIDVATTLPLVIVSQTRRTFNLELFFAEACGLYIAFAGGSLVGGPGYLYDHRVLYPLGIVIGIMLVALVFCDAYTGRTNAASHKEWMTVTFALAWAFCARSVVLAFQPDWSFPIWVMAVGGAAAVPMLSLLRDFFRRLRSNNRAMAGNGGPEDLRAASTRQHRRAWQVNWLWLLAGLCVAFTMPSVTGADGGRGRGWGAGSAIFILVIVCITAWRSMKGWVGPASRYTSLSVSQDPYREELDRKRNGLLFWIGGGLFALQPGSAGPTLIFVIIAFPLCLLLLRVFTDSSAIQAVLARRYWVSFIAFFALIVGWLEVRKVNREAADAMRRELDELDSKDKH